MKKKVLITGGTGFIGTLLSKELISRGYDVAFLTHRKDRISPNSFYWNPENGQFDEKALDFARFVVHLAGANIGGGRWTKKRKKEIVKSRVDSTSLILDKLKENDRKPEVFVSASAIGYYGGTTEPASLDEDSPAGDDFLAKVTVEWERAVRLDEGGFRKVVLRTGVVFSPEGGALAKMAAPVRLGLGSPIGTGRQYVSWIAIEDLIGMYVYAVENPQLDGAYNAELMRALSKHMSKPFFMPHVPGVLLKAVMGEMAEIVLEGNNVSSEKIQKAGFEFAYPALDDYLGHIYR